jgi:hypothetical protein
MEANNAACTRRGDAKGSDQEEEDEGADDPGVGVAEEGRTDDRALTPMPGEGARASESGVGEGEGDAEEEKDEPTGASRGEGDASLCCSFHTGIGGGRS